MAPPASTAPPLSSQSRDRPPTSADFYNDGYQIGERVITFNPEYGWVYITDTRGGILGRAVRVNRGHWDSGTLENPSVQ